MYFIVDRCFNFFLDADAYYGVEVLPTIKYCKPL